MATRTRLTSEELAQDLARALHIPSEDATAVVKAVSSALRRHLGAGQVVELGDLFTISVIGNAELREDESGGFSAYAPTNRSLKVQPLGTLKTDLEKAGNATIYYVSLNGGQFIDLLSDHFGRRGWNLVHARNGMEVQSRMERQPPVALIFEGHVEGWREVLRELKCTPSTNRVPIVGVFPETVQDEPVAELTVQPDEIVYEPFDFADFIQTAGSELASRVTNSDHSTCELEIHLPGNQRARRETKEIVEEMLFRSGLPETFNRAAGAALAEALDNALRHGHQFVECCTIEMRMILDNKRLVMAVTDSGHGFDHASTLAAARGSRSRKGTAPDALQKAASVLRTRRGDVREGGIARMLKLVDRVDFNRRGNEVVLTKNLPIR